MSLEYACERLTYAMATALGYWSSFSRNVLLGGVNRSERFVSLNDRLWSIDLAISKQFAAAVQNAKHNRQRRQPPPINWKGILNMKDPFTLACYPLLINELKPATIIELGSYNGGSAYWLADMLEVHQVDGRVYSWDINLERIEATHPRVEFKRGDTTNLTSFDSKWLSSLVHPWLVIEDAHQNVYNVLTFFSEKMVIGDYLIVEDTVDYRKYREMRRFALDRNDEFLVDSYYTDLFGYNVTWSPNAILKKVR
jgi:cephalosporin hydroxylase